MTWFTFSLISILALATAELVQQYVLNKEEIDEKVSGILTFLLLSLLTLPIIAFSSYKNQFFDIFKVETLPYFLIDTVLATTGLYFYLKSFKVKNISISTIFISLSVVVSTTLGIILFNESTDIWKYIGIALVLISIISLNINNLSLEKNHFYGLLAGLFYGATYSLDKLIVADIQPIIYMFWSFFIASMLLYITSFKETTKELKKFTKNNFKPIIVSACGYFIYNFCTFTAYTVGGEVGRVDAINNSQIFLIIMFEYLILKQKDDLWRKILTAAIAFTGVYILGYF